jgi:hypothetical protein
MVVFGNGLPRAVVRRVEPMQRGFRPSWLARVSAYRRSQAAEKHSCARKDQQEIHLRSTMHRMHIGQTYRSEALPFRQDDI